MDVHEELLDLLDGDEEAVNAFMSKVNAGNEDAKFRISRAVKAIENSTEEVVEEEVIVDEAIEVEATEVVEEEEEEVVVEEVVEEEEEEEVVVEEVVVEEVDYEEIVLDESFIADVVGSDEFRSHVSALINTAVGTAVAEVEARYEETLRTLKVEMEENKEWVRDVPKRNKKRHVSFRPRLNPVTTNGTQDSPAVRQETLSMTELAEVNIDDIFNNSGGN